MAVEECEGGAAARVGGAGGGGGQVPGGDAAALRLVIVAIALSLVAVMASEWLARRAGARTRGE